MARAATDRALRYASHLGYLSPDEPLFRESVGSPDPVAHVEFAAARGFHGVLYPWAITRSSEEVGRVAAALRNHEMEAGCVVFAPLDVVLTPLWVQGRTTARDQLLEWVLKSATLASNLNSRILAVLVTADNDRPLKDQRCSLVENLKFAADIACSFGLVVGIEPMIDLPNMLLRHVADAYELIQEVDHPAVKLIFDTGHVQVMDGEILEPFVNFYDSVAVLQLADQPGRVEPGAGKIDLSPLLAHAILSDFRGLVELEHGWSLPGAEGEASGLERLWSVDQAARRIAEVV